MGVAAVGQRKGIRPRGKTPGDGSQRTGRHRHGQRALAVSVQTHAPKTEQTEQADADRTRGGRSASRCRRHGNRERDRLGEHRGVGARLYRQVDRTPTALARARRGTAVEVGIARVDRADGSRDGSHGERGGGSKQSRLRECRRSQRGGSVKELHRSAGSAGARAEFEVVGRNRGLINRHRRRQMKRLSTANRRGCGDGVRLVNPLGERRLRLGVPAIAQVSEGDGVRSGGQPPEIQIEEAGNRRHRDYASAGGVQRRGSQWIDAKSSGDDSTGHRADRRGGRHDDRESKGCGIS